MSINIVKHTSTNKTNYTPNKNNKYIVIHYTAGSTSRKGTAYNTASYFATSGVEASADFIVDDETIVQYNPDLRNYSTWHCGGGRQSGYGGSYLNICTNYNSIGIEICCNNDNYNGSIPANHKSWYFTDKSVNNAIELTKYLMKTYNIPAKNVIRHYDVTGKLCPGIIGWNSASGSESKWNAFKAKLTTTNTNTKTDTTKTNNVKTTDKELYRVRKAWKDSKSQIGAWNNLDNAKKHCDKNKGYYVFNSKGKIIYPTSAPNISYTVRVTADVLNVRQSNNTTSKVVTTIRRNEIYTIVSTESNWGKLKSGIGWICLDYVERT